MTREMTREELIAAYKGGRRDFTGADLRKAGLRGVNLRGAGLMGADLRGADLWNANLTNANLQNANLQDANLCGANLTGADLKGADLKGADIDYASWPIWCGGLDAKIDIRIARELVYFAFAQDCDDPEYQEARELIAKFANKFHRVKSGCVPKIGGERR